MRSPLNKSPCAAVDDRGNVLTVSVNGKEEQWEALRIIPFTSARKRMTTVIRKRGENGDLLVLMKGADNFVLERCTPSEHTKTVEHHLKLFAQTGLRTLCFGARWCTYDSLAGVRVFRHVLLGFAVVLPVADKPNASLNACTVADALQRRRLAAS